MILIYSHKRIALGLNMFEFTSIDRHNKKTTGTGVTNIRNKITLITSGYKSNKYNTLTEREAVEKFITEVN